MKILVTGAKGFIGKNLVVELKNQKYTDILEYDLDTDPSLLDVYLKECSFIFHLAGINRPQNQFEYMEGNYDFTHALIETLKKNNNLCPIVFSSSIQATLDNPYGKSKKAGEELIFTYAKETGAKVFVCRFPNIFGKWCRPNYNSVIATFCNNIAHGLPICVNDPNVIMKLVYIDDVVGELINLLNQEEISGFCEIPVTYKITLGEIVSLLNSFKKSRDELSIPKMTDEFTKKLYSTYLSYLPIDQFNYPLRMNMDHRGSFTEFIKTQEKGQISINISKPGIIKGNHWHHTKNEKFLVVSGKGVIRFRKFGTNEVNEYFVCDEKLEVIDIPPGYTHHIENFGQKDLVTIMWANEPFDPDKPDTYYLEV